MLGALHKSIDGGFYWIHATALRQVFPTVDPANPGVVQKIENSAAVGSGMSEVMLGDLIVRPFARHLRQRRVDSKGLEAVGRSLGVYRGSQTALLLNKGERNGGRICGTL
jgi:hypothetical protein